MEEGLIDFIRRRPAYHVSMPSVSHLTEEWKAEQLRRASKVIVEPLSPLPRFVAGADCAFSADGGTIYCVALVYDRKAKRVVEIVRHNEPVNIPYVPGFLSFREGPALLATIGRLTHAYGVICFDGQGIAHPRRCGIATFLGVELDVPTVGMAKSVLCGSFDEPGQTLGSKSPLVHRGQTIGQALRTRANVKPIFISIGHRVNLPSARKLALACLSKYRIPEPTRQADIEVAKSKWIQ